MPYCILTNFEGLAVYYCLDKPPTTADYANVAREHYFRYDEFDEKWDEINAMFGRDAVKTGALTKLALAQKKRGAITVDEAFLQLIGKWREMLAVNLVRNNTELESANLNFAVQMTIDRIVFLRMAEDRNLEPWGTLQTIARGTDIYAALLERFREADYRYNSGLFHFPVKGKSGKKRAGFEDELTPTLQIDDLTLSQIIVSLYKPNPFNFAVMPIEILGQVYEQFLGKVIRVSTRDPITGVKVPRRAEIEEKPEVRKAGGVYYTPSYIVNAIVEQTLRPLCDGKTARQLDALRVLDPASGSGSFLIGAYAWLLSWHLEFYTRDPDKHLKGKDAPIFAKSDPQDASKKIYRLTTREKKRILINNIYGVDIDRQAVEVTKLSLLLRVLEDESSEGLKLLSEPALPDLDNNIRCGNSLIGPDFYDADDMDDLPATARDRINAFDWQSAFPDAFKAGGFDAVIGNPPYIRIQAMQEWAPLEVEFLKGAYVSASRGNYDIYVTFIERALSLMNERGRLGFILPHKFFNAKYGETTRELLSAGRHLRAVVHFGDIQIFENATTYTCLLFADKAPVETAEITRVTDVAAWQNGQIATGTVENKSLSGEAWNFSMGTSGALLDKLAAMPIKLGDVDVTDRIFQGLVTGADPVFILRLISAGEKTVTVHSKALNATFKIENSIVRPLLKGAEIERYKPSEAENVILFPYAPDKSKLSLLTESQMKQYPLAWAYLNKARSLLEAREGGKWKVPLWWQFGRNQNLAEMPKPKILTQVLSKEGSYTMDAKGDYCFVGGGNAGGYGVQIAEDSELSPNYILALLNSKVLNFYLRAISTTFRGGFYSYARRYIEQLPIRAIDFGDVADVKRHDDIVALVEKMLEAQVKLAGAKNPATKAGIAATIQSLDRRIDGAVFALYDLDADEIALVGGA